MTIFKGPTLGDMSTFRGLEAPFSPPTLSPIALHQVLPVEQDLKLRDLITRLPLGMVPIGVPAEHYTVDMAFQELRKRVHPDLWEGILTTEEFSPQDRDVLAALDRAGTFPDMGRVLETLERLVETRHQKVLQNLRQMIDTIQEITKAVGRISYAVSLLTLASPPCRDPADILEKRFDDTSPT